MESVRVRLRTKKGRGWFHQEIEIPTDVEMEAISARLHAERFPKELDVLGWRVIYLPSGTLRYSSTEVNPFTSKSGKTVPSEASMISYCVFGYGAEWQVSYCWNQGDDLPPQRIQERGDVVPMPECIQGSLFDDAQNEGSSKNGADETFAEGAVRRAETTIYERNSEARLKCVAHYGTRCVVCGFDFGIAYGEVAKELIHVHHLTPLSEIHAEAVVDPIRDLRPVCPNCHSVLHLQTPPYTIEQVRAFLGLSYSRQ